jgi:hypothetical protein
MTGPEHAEMAELLLDEARDMAGAEVGAGDPLNAMLRVRMAEAHGQLAAVALERDRIVAQGPHVIADTRWANVLRGTRRT